MNTENSDLDFRGVYIPTLDDIILKKDKDEINTEIELPISLTDFCNKFLSKDFNNIDDILDELQKRREEYGDYCEHPEIPRNTIKKVDVKIFSLQKFIQLCSKADTNALDLLFSIDTPADHTWQYKGLVKNVPEEMKYPLRYIHENRNKLINTDRLESPITYAFKQATKYGLKGERLKVLEEVLQIARQVSIRKVELGNGSHTVGDLCRELILLNKLDDKHLKIDELDNKGKLETYLFVCGVQHQFNLELDKFIKRIEEKINKEYTSQRTIDAKDGNDWKALSHAIRVLLEVKELLNTGNIQFPLKDKDFLLDIKLGKVERKDIDEFFNKELSEILERVQKNKLDWKYDEEFWNEFILKETKNG